MSISCQEHDCLQFCILWWKYVCLTPAWFDKLTSVPGMWVWNSAVWLRCCMRTSGIILSMRPANERCRYTVMPSLIGWAHTRNDPWTWQAWLTELYWWDCDSWKAFDWVNSIKCCLFIILHHFKAITLTKRWKQMIGSEWCVLIAYDWCLFLRVQLTVWISIGSGKWLGAVQMISHFINQCWPWCLMPYYFTRPQLVHV